MNKKPAPPWEAGKRHFSVLVVTRFHSASEWGVSLVSRGFIERIEDDAGSEQFGEHFGR